ncbi:hypothetical protein [uncultured Brevundimonas sp.]|uniref:hypothetical protein n=1 Tax=uncultured Brevundimonas sp. TaxID=213418 RepID=UPI0025D7DC3E|nr:hypothetical protein [uncultured Brevundimonas sp.]
MGMSVYRLSYASDDELKFGAENLVGRKRRDDPHHGLMGVIVFRAEMVKNRFGEDACPFCLYGTELPQLPSHADVYQRVTGSTDELKLERRRALFDLVSGGFQPLSKFKSGLLLPWAAHGAP